MTRELKESPIKINRRAEYILLPSITFYNPWWRSVCTGGCKNQRMKTKPKQVTHLPCVTVALDTIPADISCKSWTGQQPITGLRWNLLLNTTSIRGANFFPLEGQNWDATSGHRPEANTCCIILLRCRMALRSQVPLIDWLPARSKTIINRDLIYLKSIFTAEKNIWRAKSNLCAPGSPDLSYSSSYVSWQNSSEDKIII